MMTVKIQLEIMNSNFICWQMTLVSVKMSMLPIEKNMFLQIPNKNESLTLNLFGLNGIFSLWRYFFSNSVDENQRTANLTFVPITCI